MCAALHTIDLDEKASIVVHMKENPAKYVVTWFWMYRCIDFPTKISNLIFSEIIIMKNVNIRMSILQTTDFDQTLSELQSPHSKHILFSDDRNLTDRFFIHLTWRFSIILFSRLSWNKNNYHEFRFLKNRPTVFQWNLVRLFIAPVERLWATFIKSG